MIVDSVRVAFVTVWTVDVVPSPRRYEKVASTWVMSVVSAVVYVFPLVNGAPTGHLPMVSGHPLFCRKIV